MIFVKLLHLFAVLAWVGGMFFAYVILRPAAVAALPPPERLRLWSAVFQRFFNWVWSAVLLILASGLYMIYLYGGIAHAPHHVHLMLMGGLAMMGIYGYVYFACYVPFSLHVDKQRWQEAGAVLGRIRKWIALNLALGGLTIAVAVVGPVWI